MEYRTLGASGLEVSVLAFGTATFGGRGDFAALGNVQVDEARTHIDICLDAGVNIFDTADMYSSGEAEVVLGKALGSRRKDVVVATKCLVRLDPGPNKTGLSRAHIIEACEASLRRLGTDYIDLYQCHNFDAITPQEETLRAFDDLVRSGKVRWFGSSNHSGWQLMKAHAISERLGIGRYISQQINYSLIERHPEHELVPLALDQRTGIMVWSPLQSGLLSGKFRRNGTRPEETRLNSHDAPGHIDYEKLYAIVDALDRIAKQRNASVSQVALNWLVRKPGVDTVILGARNEAQLRDNLAAATWTLTEEEIIRLDNVSAVPLPYPGWRRQKFPAARNPPGEPRPL